MSKEEIIELINSRIKYYTGGEAWKSLNESICDKRIVGELESIKENILNQKEDEIEDRTADIDEDMPGEFVKIKEDE